MTTKEHSDSSDVPDDGIEDSIDDSLDDLLLKAQETPSENPVKSANGSHEASDSAEEESVSENVSDVALDIAVDVTDGGGGASPLRANASAERESDPGFAAIPIPDVISADSPDDVPRGGVAGEPVTPLPVRVEDVMVSEDEVRVKVEPTPHDEAETKSSEEARAAMPDDVSPLESAILSATYARNDDESSAEEADENGENGGSEDTTANARGRSQLDDDDEPELTGDDGLRERATPVAGHHVVADGGGGEDETKIEPYVSAMRAAASVTHDDEPEAGLATQAREERDRALRQSAALSDGPLTPPTAASHPVPVPGSSPSSEQFDDSENDLKLDDDTETESPSGLHKLPPPSRTPPAGYPGRRLPTPTPGILQGPVGAGYAAALGTNPGMPRLTPSKTMPGIKPPSPSSAIFNTVRLPLGGLLAVLGAAFGGGLLIGAVLWRVAPPEMATHAPQEQVAAPVAAEPAAPAPPAPAPPAPAAAPAPTAAAAQPPAAPTAEAPAAPADPTPAAAATGTAAARTPTQPQPATAGRVTRPAVTGAVAKPVVRPKRTASASGKKTAWVDPFAQ